MFRLKQLQGKQLLSRCCCQQHVFFGGECRHTVSGLAGNCHSASSLGNNLPYFFQQHGCTIQVDLQYCFDRCLTGGYSCRIHQVSDISILLCFGNDRKYGFPRREVCFHRHRIKSGSIQQVCRSLCMRHTLVPNDYFLSGSNSSYDGKSYLSGSHPYNRVCSFFHNSKAFMPMGKQMYKQNTVRVQQSTTCHLSLCICHNSVRHGMRVYLFHPLH